jgi:deoxyhypusine synthase
MNVPNVDGSNPHQRSDKPPAKSLEAVLVPSLPISDDAVLVRGYDFNRGVDYSALLNSYLQTGFQASSFGKAVIEVNRMVR